MKGELQNPQNSRTGASPSDSLVFYPGIKIKKSKVGDHSWGWPEGFFSIARGGHYSFPRIDPFYPWSIPYNAEC